MAKTAKKKPPVSGGGINTSGDHIEDVAHEDIPNEKKHQATATTEVEVITVEEQIRLELAKFNPAEAGIAELKQQFGGLTIAGVEDKQGYKTVREAWSTVRSTRTALEKKGKQLRDDYTKINKAISAEEDRLVELIKPLEEQLHGTWKAIDDEKERVKKEAEEAEQKRLMERVEEIQTLGMVFKDGFYQIGDTISIDVASLRAFDADQYEKLKGHIAAKKKELDDAEAERKERQRLEDEKREEDARKLAEAQKKLDDDRAELDRQRQEMEQQKAQAGKLIRDNRIAQLAGLGQFHNEYKGVFVFDNGFRKVENDAEALLTMADDVFQENLKQIAEAIKQSENDRAKHLAEVEKEKQAMEDHKKMIADKMNQAGLSFSYTNQSFYWEDANTSIDIPFSSLISMSEAEIVQRANDAEVTITRAKKLTEAKEKAAKEAAEKEEKAGLADKDRFAKDLALISDAVSKMIPEEYKTAKYQKKAQIFAQQITHLILNEK